MTTINNVYDLIPTNNQKSYYGKARVHVMSDGSEVLYSYGTPIVKRTANGDLIKLWSGWSATTGKHIKSFCGLNKAGFDKL